MKRLLCGCLCLLLVVGSLPMEARSQKSEVGINGTAPFVHLPNFFPGAASQSQNPSDKNFRVPTSDFRLPCQDSSPTCLQTLSDLAVQNSREWAVLGQAIALQKKKLWTNWLSADGLNPLAIALRIARNIAGGGERAAAQLELARLELRRAELASQLRDAVARAVFAFEMAQRELTLAQSRLTVHQTRLAWLTIAYRLGEGSTETMLQLWQQEAELQAALEQARASCAQRRTQLQGVVWPAPPTIIPTIKLSQKS